MDEILTVEVDLSKLSEGVIDPASKTEGATVLSETGKPVSYCRRDSSSSACKYGSVQSSI